MSNIFMQIQGVEGNVTAPNYKGWIELDGFDFGVERNVSTKVGQMSDREGTTPRFSEVEIIKRLDKASNDLFTKTCGSKAIPQVNIHICSTDSLLTPYAKYALSDVIISAHNTSAAAETVPQELLSLSYAKIERTYITRDKANKNLAPDTVGYDLVSAQQI
jgi:type VI secretion system secreted protein Hcp